MADPLTIRYNNPGAIEYKPFLAKYGATVGPNGRYAQFPDVESGYKAMEGLLGTYQTKHGLNTVEGIVNRWAPPNVDNNSTSTYSMKVAQRLGVDPKAPFDPSMTPKLAEAMAAYEAGRPVPRDAQSTPITQGAPAMAAPALTPYDGPSPDEVAMQRKLAMSLMQQGTSTEPVGHWTQALARVLQGGVGGMYKDTAREGEKQGRASIASSLSGNPNPATMATNPWLGDLGIQMYKAQSSAQPLIIPEGGTAIVPDRANPGSFKPLTVGQPKTRPDEKNYEQYKSETMKAGGQPMSFMDYQIKLKQAGATAITNDMRGENAESKARGEGLGKRLNEVAQDGMEARKDAVLFRRLSELSQNVDPGTKAATLEQIRKLTGIALDPNADNVQAFTAISNYLTPRMRVPGSGASSDRDVAMFLAALPGMLNTPGGMEMINQTFDGITKARLYHADVAQKWQRGEIKAAEADKMMAEAPDPFASFRGAMPPQQQQAGPKMPKPGEVKQGYRYKGGDPAKQESWEKIK